MPFRLTIPTALMLVCAWCAVAGEKPWTLDALMNLKTISDVELTGDGTKVAYVVQRVDGRRNAYDSEIWVVPASGGQARQLALPDVSDRQPRWSADGQKLAFLSGRDGITQVYVVTGAGGTPRKVTGSPTDVEFFQWSPDGGRIGYLARDPIPAQVLERRKAGDDPIVAGEGYRYTRLHLVSLNGGQPQIVEAGGRHLLSFNWAPDGSKVVYAAQPTPKGRDQFNVDIYETDLASGRDAYFMEGDIYQGTSPHIVGTSPVYDQTSGGDINLRWQRSEENGSGFTLQAYFDRTLRTGGARYVPDFARSRSPRRLSSRCSAYCSALCPSTPVAPSFRVRR